MKKAMTIAAIAATAGMAAAGSTLVIDVSGIESWEFQGDALNTILNVFVGANASITNIAWDVNLTTLGISWAEENTMGFFGDSEQVFVAPGLPEVVTNVNFTGSQASSIVLGVDGMLDIEFYETDWNDNPAAVDGFYEAGSSITITYTPAPSALAVLGLGGLVAGRRRR